MSAVSLYRLPEGARRQGLSLWGFRATTHTTHMRTQWSFLQSTKCLCIAHLFCVKVMLIYPQRLFPPHQCCSQIVTNPLSGVDVDKWDYYQRDCHHLGLPGSFDIRQVLYLHVNYRYMWFGPRIPSILEVVMYTSSRSASGTANNPMCNFVVKTVYLQFMMVNIVIVRTAVTFF